jgi:hypothetical protein
MAISHQAGYRLSRTTETDVIMGGGGRVTSVAIGSTHLHFVVKPTATAKSAQVRTVLGILVIAARVSLVGRVYPFPHVARHDEYLLSSWFQDIQRAFNEA